MKGERGLTSPAIEALRELGQKSDAIRLLNLRVEKAFNAYQLAHERRHQPKAPSYAGKERAYKRLYIQLYTAYQDCLNFSAEHRISTLPPPSGIEGGTMVDEITVKCAMCERVERFYTMLYDPNFGPLDAGWILTGDRGWICNQHEK